ncbi:MAG: Ku protein [Christensenellales bacterium]|jgi:DNA end-binding protein Ku
MANWKGSISFGLIYIPISLQIAAQEERVSFNQLHKDTLKRIRYLKTCEGCKDVRQSDIVKGYEYEKDKYVIFSDEDFEKLKTEKNKSIMIEQFVNLSEIDPIYYERAYYVIPQGAEKAFELLKKAMSEENKVGIAKAVFGEKENLVALRVINKEMVLNTLFFHYEIKKSQAKEININLDDKELKLAKQIIGSMTAPFEPEKYTDSYRERLLQAIDMKIKGEEIVKTEDKKLNIAIDLMDALTRSLEAARTQNALQ